MKSLEAVVRMWSTQSDRAYVLIGLVVLVLSRLIVISLTPRTADFSDPRIYQGTGQVVLAGINPYDYSDQPQLREKLRREMAVLDTDRSFAYSTKSWNYYVSGNLPASTALYATFEYISHGSRHVWRLLFILGDVAMFLGMVSLFKAFRGGHLDVWSQIAAFFLVIANPSLVLSGTAVPEDKQFQTALMLFGAAFLVSPRKINVFRGLGGGLLLSVSVLFKFFGAFLLPIWLIRAKKEWPRFPLSTIAGALVPAAASLIAFGPYFLLTMSDRAVQNNAQRPVHASPWILVPWLTENYYIAAKLALVVGLCAFLVTLLAKRRIDLLNCCAGFSVAFACVWLDKGSMNRVNIAIIFAIATLLSLGSKMPAIFSAVAALITAVGYAVGLMLLHVNHEQVEAVLVLMFLVSYVIVLAMNGRPVLDIFNSGNPYASVLQDRR